MRESFYNVLSFFTPSWVCSTWQPTRTSATCDLMEISLMAKKINDYGSGIPQIEMDALVSTLLPTIQAFFESEEGKRKFEEWKAAKETEKTS